jgi:hypothetical protein
MLVSSILRRGQGRYFHWCPACEEMHQLPDSWTFNGDVERPTFSPSFKHGGLRSVIKDGRWTGEYHRGPGGEPLDGTCHYFITGGMIQFCPDSWHKRSDIVAMPPLPRMDDFQFEQAT